ncbi:MAG: hypothetical protein ABI597_00860 [Gammaproteobacteria bacterium]
MSGIELPKVIDKSEADIEAAITAIKASDMPRSTQDFAISCIKLAVWLPKALLEQKIKLSNLRKLIFSLGGRNKKKPENSEQADTTNSTKSKENESTPFDAKSVQPEAPTMTNVCISGHQSIALPDCVARA